MVAIVDTDPYSITFSISLGNQSWVCTCVYASPTPANRGPLWHRLVTIGSSLQTRWLLIGDFNETLLLGDQRGCHFSHARAAAFARVFDQCGLVDLHMIGDRFTWHRNTHGVRSMAMKLDRAIASFPWRLAFPDALVEVLCRYHSDHNPLLLRVGGILLHRVIALSALKRLGLPMLLTLTL